MFGLYAPEDYLPGGRLIPILVLGFYVRFLYSIAVNYEFYHKKVKYTATVTIIAALINIVMNYFMINRFGIDGAAAASSLAYLCEFVLHYIYAKYYITNDKYPFTIRFMFKHLLLLFVFCIIYLYTTNYWLIRWILGFSLGIFIIDRIIRRRTIF